MKGLRAKPFKKAVEAASLVSDGHIPSPDVAPPAIRAVPDLAEL